MLTQNYLKKCSITPTEVLAGDSVEFTITLIVASDFSTDQSRIILDHPAYVGTDRPSRFDQEDGGYAEVFCSNADWSYECKTWDMEIVDFPTREKTSFKGMAQRMLVIDFLSGIVKEGDEVIIKWGWTRNGFGVGCKVPSIVMRPKFINTLHVRYFSDGLKALPDLGRSFKGYERPKADVEMPLQFQVLPREPESMRLIHGHVEDALLVQDRFFNICPDAELNSDWKKNFWGVGIMPSGKGNVESPQLALRNTPEMKHVFNNYNIYFGDLHNHSSFSNDCIEREKQEMTPDDSFGYARHVARLDFQAITDHHQSWDIERNKIGADNWSLLLEAVRKHNKTGEFLAFPGFEFRCKRGDTAIVFPSQFPYEKIDKPEISDIRKLWELFNGEDYVSIPHFHNTGGLADNEWWECPYDGIETIFEIYSCHGAYDVSSSIERRPPILKSRRPDRNGKWMLDKAYKYGYCANSDGHKGNAGMNGLTAVFAKELTSEAIFEAIRKRRVYGTTNARIRLLVSAGNNFMGSILKCGEVSEIKIEVMGEAPLKAVEVLRNGELYKRFKPKQIAFSDTLPIDSSEPAYWYVRAVQIDNEIAWSSPIWFE